MSLSHFFPRSYWDPLRRGYSPSCLLDLDFGLPPYPEQPLRDWMEWMENRFSTSRSGTLCSGLADNATASRSTSSISQPLARGTSVPQRKLSCWKISLDVKHFTPDELQVKTQEGYLEISGMPMTGCITLIISSTSLCYFNLPSIGSDFHSKL